MKILFGFALFFTGMIVGGCIVMKDCMDEKETVDEDDIKIGWEYAE